VILVLGGTSEARELTLELRHAGHEVLLSVAGEYGALTAADAERAGATVRSGALTPEELAELVADAAAVIDATHPFAAVISREARDACVRAGRPYLWLRRPSGELPANVLRAADAARAAELAVACAGGGTILLTVGSKTLAEYVPVAHAAGLRVVARVLPTEASLRVCAAAGLKPRDVVAFQGPTSAALDAALLRHLGATVLVSKDSGEAGGLYEKLRAAELVGATAIVVERPCEGGAAAAGGAPPSLEIDVAVAVTSVECVASVAEALAWVARVLGGSAASAATVPNVGRTSALRRGLLQVYTGDGKGKTTAAVGLALRARGAGLAVTFIQFVKGGRESSELPPLRAAGVRVVRPAVARSGLLRGAATAADHAAATAAWEAARTALCDPSCDLLVLDELHAALRHELLPCGEVLAAIASRQSRQEVVTSGRDAPDDLLALADLVTVMQPARHPYPDVSAREGIEL